MNVHWTFIQAAWLPMLVICIWVALLVTLLVYVVHRVREAE